jgi:predicted regulator of amino acid metabolism with ACT domain
MKLKVSSENDITMTAVEINKAEIVKENGDDRESVSEFEEDGWIEML